MLWHHTVLHVPADQVIDAASGSFPAVPALSEYDGVGFGATPYRARNVFTVSYSQDAPPYVQPFRIPLSVNFTSTYRPDSVLSSPFPCVTFPWVERAAWHCSHAYLYFVLSVCVWCGGVNVNVFPGPIDWWQAPQAVTVARLSHRGSVAGVPWQYVAEQARTRDLTAPGLLGYLLPPAWTVAIVAGAAVALVKDLPAMLLAVSRLMFAWAEDGIFPRAVARVHPVWRTPHVAIILSGVMASLGILGSHLAGDFFLGVDILVTSMLVNFLLMCVSVITLPGRNPAIGRDVRVLASRRLQVPLALFGVVVLGGFLAIHTVKDLTAPVSAWYFRSTPVWIAVMAIATAIYVREIRHLRRSGVDVNALFSTLPPE